MVVFKIRESVPIARYSPVCNVLRQWKTSLILTYRVYRDSMMRIIISENFVIENFCFSIFTYFLLLEASTKFYIIMGEFTALNIKEHCGKKIIIFMEKYFRFNY